MMRMLRGVLATAAAALLVWALVACGGEPKTSQPSGAGLVVDITIAKGQVTPSNATLQATVKEPITLRVTSDAADELHVHSVPDHKFQVAAAVNQSFQFSVDVPGNVDVELHHLDRTVATIQVRP
jgi:long-subunit fatty acid transport protein